MQTVDERDQNEPVASELDRRLWPRVGGGESEATLWTSVTESQQVTVLNESQTGVAVLVDDTSRLHLEREVRLIFGGELMWALVRHTTPEEGGMTRVGLEWGCAESRLSPLSSPSSDLE